MLKILFVRSENAFLPEIDAYINYFNKIEGFKAFDSSKIQLVKLDEFDVIWEFKGLGGIKKSKRQILVHEYASLSTGACPLLKNIIKSKLNPKADIRIFLNEDVKNGFHFNDSVEYTYRDMGINEKFIIEHDTNKEFDYVYVGSICKQRQIDKLLQVFTANYNGKFCLIGDIDDNIYREYKGYKNLIFTGKIPYTEVPVIASKAEFGINFVPDRYPFNIQTSTKLIEYLALGLKIVTTDYKWIREFEKNHKCSFYKLNGNKLQFCNEAIKNFHYRNGFIAEDYLWDNVIERSRVDILIREKIHPLR